MAHKPKILIVFNKKTIIAYCLNQRGSPWPNTNKLVHKSTALTWKAKHLLLSQWAPRGAELHHSKECSGISEAFSSTFPGAGRAVRTALADTCPLPPDTECTLSLWPGSTLSGSPDSCSSQTQQWWLYGRSWSGRRPCRHGSWGWT